MSEVSLDTVTALVGLKALERAAAEAAPGTALCTGVDIPFYPRLSIRSNAHGGGRAGDGAVHRRGYPLLPPTEHPL